MRRHDRFTRAWALLALLIAVLSLESSTAAAPRGIRPTAKFTSFVDDAALSLTPRATVTQVAEVQAKAALPRAWPRVALQSGQRSIPVAQRGDVASVARGIRSRQAVSASQRPLFMTSREGAAHYNFARPPIAPTGQQGTVRLVNNRVSVQLGDNVVYDLGFRVTNSARPTAAQVKGALRELPSALAGQPVAPTQLIYQEGRFWLAAEKTNTILLLQPLSVDTQAWGTGVAAVAQPPL